MQFATCRVWLREACGPERAAVGRKNRVPCSSTPCGSHGQLKPVREQPIPVTPSLIRRLEDDETQGTEQSISLSVLSSTARTAPTDDIVELPPDTTAPDRDTLRSLESNFGLESLGENDSHKMLIPWNWTR